MPLDPFIDFKDITLFPHHRHPVVHHSNEEDLEIVVGEPKAESADDGRFAHCPIIHSNLKVALEQIEATRGPCGQPVALAVIRA